MGIKEDIENLVLFEKKNILFELDILKKELGIDKKVNSIIDFIDDLDSIYLRNLDLETNKKEITEQLKNNKHKKLELWGYIKGKKTYIKSFGTISNINTELLTNIFKFIILFKLVKKINASAYYASQYYGANTIFEDL